MFIQLNNLVGKIFLPAIYMYVSNECMYKCRTTNVMKSLGGEFGQFLKFSYG